MAGCHGGESLSGTGGAGATGGSGGSGRGHRRRRHHGRELRLGRHGGTPVGGSFGGKINNEIDILFMIDNSSSMTEMQEKLYAQLPLFMQVLQSLPIPPSLHVAVVSSDMGAPGRLDQPRSCCTTPGDQGAFQSHAARHLHGHHAQRRATPSSPTPT